PVIAFLYSRAVTLTAREERRAGNRHPSEGTCTLIIRALMICVAPAVSAHPCHLPVPISATSMPHISAHLNCLSVSPISATYQCPSVPPIGAIYQCCLSVPISDACQCPSVPPISAHH
ncbi:unnamed protein product, partial [Staurois parvus]